LGIVGIGRNGIVTRQIQSVNSVQLAIRQRRIGLDASVRSVTRCIEEIESLNVGGRQFGAFDREIAKEAGGFPCGANEDVAYHTLAVGVDPLVALDDLDQIGEIEVLLLARVHQDVGGGVEGSPVNTDAMGKCLIVHLVSDGFVEPINSASGDFNEFGREAELVIRRQTREIISGRVDPSEQEVVITIGQSLDREEKFVGSGLIECSPLLCVQGNPIDQEISSLSLFDPLSVRGSLDSISRPVGRFHGALADVQDAIEPKSKGSVSGGPTHSPADHRIETVKASNGKEISGMNQRFIDCYDLSLCRSFRE